MEDDKSRLHASFYSSASEEGVLYDDKKGIEVQSNIKFLLKTKKNIYGKSQSGRVRNKLLVEKLTSSEVGFREIKAGEYVLYLGKGIYILYTENYVMEGTDEEQLRQSVSGIKTEDLDITTGGYIEDLLRVNIDNVDRNTYHMSQT